MYNAAIQLEIQGDLSKEKIIPLFASKKHCQFKTIRQAEKKAEATKLLGRLLVWPAGTRLADMDWNNVWTYRL